MAKMNGQPMYWAAFNNILRLFKSNEKLFLQQELKSLFEVVSTELDDFLLLNINIIKMQ